MSRSVPEVFEEALALGDDDRARLVSRLVDTLDGGGDDDVEPAWTRELERRLGRIDAGEAALLSMDDAIARMHDAARGR